MLLLEKYANRVWRVAAFGLIAVLLAACFKPMLAEQPGTGGVTSSLADIYIEALPDRIGQRVRNHLIGYFSGASQNSAARYRLSISLSKSVTSGLVRPNKNSLAETVELTARFTLIEVASEKVVHGGESFARATYDKDRVGALFANERALLDAENRAADELAEDMRARIGAYFAANPG